MKKVFLWNAATLTADEFTVSEDCFNRVLEKIKKDIKKDPGRVLFANRVGQTEGRCSFEDLDWIFITDPEDLDPEVRKELGEIGWICDLCNAIVSKDEDWYDDGNNLYCAKCNKERKRILAHPEGYPTPADERDALIDARQIRWEMDQESRFFI